MKIHVVKFNSDNPQAYARANVHGKVRLFHAELATKKRNDVDRAMAVGENVGEVLHQIDLARNGSGELGKAK